MKKHGDKKKKKKKGMQLWSDATALEGPRLWARGVRDQKTRFGSCLERLRAMADVLREKRNAT
jgi:hypothetical protein